jgi:hypothetical protein
MDMWQRPVSLKMSWDFSVLGRVTRYRGRSSLNRMISVTYIAKERTHITGNTSHDHHPPLRDVAADTENTYSSTVACWIVFTELLLGNALFKSVTILFRKISGFK